MGNNLETKITADIVDLQQKFAVARAETSSLGSEMRKLAQSAAAGTLDTAGQSQFAQIAQDYLQAKASAASYSAQMRETSDSTRGFGDTIEDTRSKLSTLFQVSGAAAAYEAIKQVVDIVKELGDRALDIRNMSDVLDVTTAQFQAMSAAADEAGISDSVLMRANEKLKTTIAEAAAGSGEAIIKVKALGLGNDEAALKSMSLNDALVVIGDRLKDSTTHSEEMAAATQLLGGRAALAAAAWEKYDGSTAGVAASNRRLNALTEEQTKNLSENAVAIKETGTVAANTGSQLLLFAENFDAGGLKIAETVGSLFTTAGQAQLAMKLLGQGGSTTSPQIGQIQRVTTAAQASATQITAAVLQSEQTQVEATDAGTAQRVALARKYYQDSQQFYGNDNVAEVRSAFREMQSAEKEFSSAHLASLREEAAAAKEKDRDDTASYRESLAAMKEADKEFDTINRQNAAADIQIQRDSVAAKKALLEAEVGDSAQASATKFAALRTLVNQEYDLDQQALENELTGLEDQPAAYNRVYNEIRELKAKQVEELAQLDQQQAQAARRAAQQDSQGWKDSVREIESAEGTLLGDLISKRKSLGASLVQVGAQFLQQELTNDVKAMTTRILLTQTEENSKKALEQGGMLYHLLFSSQATAQTVASQTAQTQAVITGNAARTAATASGAASSKAAGAAANSSVVMADAAKAFSGTYASVAQIPYVGWILAPAAGAAAFAAVAAYEGLASLDVGTAYVPRDMNARIHEGEAVLPKPMAQSFRDGTLGGEGGGDVHHYHGDVNIHGGTDLLKQLARPEVAHGIMKAVQGAYGRGARG